jgi:hypothetical protein
LIPMLEDKMSGGMTSFPFLITKSNSIGALAIKLFFLSKNPDSLDWEHTQL